MVRFTDPRSPACLTLAGGLKFEAENVRTFLSGIELAQGPNREKPLKISRFLFCCCCFFKPNSALTCRQPDPGFEGASPACLKVGRGT